MNCKTYKKLADEAPPLTLGKMLKEFRRTWNYFTYLDGKGDEKFPKLDLDFVSALAEEYGMKVFAYEIIDPELSPDSIVPRKIVDRYIRCNEYCAEHILKKSKKG